MSLLACWTLEVSYVVIDVGRAWLRVRMCACLLGAFALSSFSRLLDLWVGVRCALQKCLIRLLGGLRKLYVICDCIVEDGFMIR